jgi:uncharacterized protein (TIGR02594 family)
MAILRTGMRGSEVASLQLLLNAKVLPSPRLRADGDFGRKTLDAVQKFQFANKLKADGIVGPKTWQALGQKMPVVAPPPAAVGAPWMNIAQAELGVHENALPGQHTKRIIEYHRTTTLKATADETPWCSSFVNWAMTTAGYKGTNNALAKSWVDWGMALDQPRAGAVTVIKRQGKTSDVATGSSTGFHVAFYVSSNATQLRLLGGNQSDQVKYSSFSLKAYEIRGYRWPI